MGHPITLSHCSFPPSPSPSLAPQAPIRRFHSLCHDLGSMRMHKIEADRIYTLDAFIDAHEEHRQVWMHVEVWEGVRTARGAQAGSTVKTELVSCCPCNPKPR